MEKLLSLIYNYSINDKLIDEEYIEKFIDVVINSKLLDKYVCDLQILSSENDKLPEVCVSAYNLTDKTIYVDFNNINKYLQEADRYQALFNEDEQTFYKNSIFSQTILHELEHANQYKIMDNEESLEAKILNLSKHNLKDSEINELEKNGYSIKDITIYIIKRQIVYSKFYLKSPLERLAEIKSYQEMIILLSNIKKLYLIC